MQITQMDVVYPRALGVKFSFKVLLLCCSFLPMHESQGLISQWRPAPSSPIP
jgi:hypothetical protein